MARFIISGLGDEVSPILSEQMDVFEKLGIKYIETRVINGLNISKLTTEQAEEAKTELDSRGFKVSAVSSPIGKTYITEPFEEVLELFKHVVHIAKIFETNYIRIFSFFIPESEEPEKYRQEVINRLKIMVSIAEQNNIILLHENDKGIYGDSPKRLLDIFKTVNSNNLLLTLDAPNFIKSGYEAYPKAFEMLYDYIGYVHLKDSMNDKTIVPFGTGDTHGLEYLRRLNEKDFQCFLALEPHVHEIQGLEESYKKNSMEKSRSSTFELAYRSFLDVYEKI
jgi:sugar phosphate isomerase/epimerase